MADRSENLSEHSRWAYASDLRILERAVGGDLLLNSLTAEVLLGFFDGQRRQRINPRTIMRRACAIRGMRGWLVDEGHSELSPLDGVRLLLRKDRRLPRSVPVEELLALIRQLAPEAEVRASVQPVARLDRSSACTTLLSVLLMVGTGIRVSETAAIKLSDLELGAQRIRIHGNGSRERHVYLADPWLVHIIESYPEMRSAVGIDYACMLFNRDRAPLSAPGIRAPPAVLESWLWAVLDFRLGSHTGLGGRDSSIAMRVAARDAQAIDPRPSWPPAGSDAPGSS